jgi:class 3 adenylate cyclase/tetratricopeptide (TPR) repeat protein
VGIVCKRAAAEPGPSYATAMAAETPRCSDCGAAVAATGRFCAECGARTPRGALPAETRKVVTVVFCDVVGSTALGERLDPEAQRALMTRYFEEMRRVLESHGGRVEKFIGDAVMAVFGVPFVHEDDALRAARAAVGMQAAVTRLSHEIAASYGVELAARIGVNTGEVVVGDGTRGTVATGDAVNTAARLEQAAAPGEVLLGQTTVRLLRDLVMVDEIEPVTAKGKAAPVRAWRLMSVPEGTGRVEHSDGELPLVGRSRELRFLGDCYERALEERLCLLVNVLAVAGTGKSRLVQEFVRRLPADPAPLVLQGRCLSYGDGIAFWPLLEILRTAAGVHGGEPADKGRARLDALVGNRADREVLVDRLAPLAGLPGRAAGQDEIHAAVRTLLEIIGRARPVVLVVDDIHWAEPALLDLLDHVLAVIRDVPLMVICLGRPDILESRPGWGASVLNATNVQLAPLPETDVAQLIGGALSDAPVDAEIPTAIALASGGNALFVGQLLAMLREDGRVALIDGVWSMTRRIDKLELPPSIGALLRARLDRLPDDERAVLEAASVLGTVFYAGALVDLMDPAPAGVPREELTRLLRRDLIRTADSDLEGEEGYRFLHVLVREAAYNALPKAVRAHQHERFAHWLESRADRAHGDVDEFVGYHLEQAFRLRRELAPVDEETGQLGTAAAIRLAAAAERLGQADPRGAASLLRRAAETTADAGRRCELLISEGRALYEAGDLANSLRCFDEAAAAAQDLGDDRIDIVSRLERAYVADQVGESQNMADLLALADEAERRFDSVDHPDVAVAASTARVLVHNVYARWSDVLAASEEGIESARRAGDLARLRYFREIVVAVFPNGPLPVADAFVKYERMIAEDDWDIATPTEMPGAMAVLCAMADLEMDARAWLVRGQEAIEQRPDGIWTPMFHTFTSDVELICGNLAASERALRRAVDWLESHGERSWLSTYAAAYAARFLDVIDPREAERLLEVAKSATMPDDAVSQSITRMLEALMLSQAQRFEEAVPLAHQGVEWAERTDQSFYNGQVNELAARVLLESDDLDGAIAALRRALQWFEAKGDIPDARRLRERLTSLAGANANQG